MSGPYDRAGNLNLSDMMEQGYPVYDGPFAPQYPRLAGPPSHHDGVGFWYRPSNGEQLYGRDSTLFNRGVALPGNAMEIAGIKHRRTRSGCFTCRSRRVKCDEARPVCERCKKGGRDCEFPQPSSSSKRMKHGEPRSPQERPKQKSEESSVSGLDTIKDESEEEVTSPVGTKPPGTINGRSQSIQSLSRKPKYRQTQDTSPRAKDRASPHSTASSSSHSRSETPASSMRAKARSAELQARQAKIKALSPDMQKYLQFQHDHMTHYHYFFKLDPTDFVHNELIDQALSFEPLLYAVVAFAAYHYELRRPNGKLSTVLCYHSKSLSMLRKSLEGHSQFSEAMLLTALQFATFEEYMGDWVNLIGHHRAAHMMILKLYTADSMMSKDLSRRIFSWYARFDVIAGLMAGNETRLDRSWFEANINWYHEQIDSDPEGDLDVENTLAFFVASNRLVGMDMATLFAKLPKNQISIEDFRHENEKIIGRLDEMKRQIESLNDEFYTVQDFSAERTRPLDEDDIVNPYIPGGLFKDALWPLNFMWTDWYAIEQMQKYQVSLLLQQPLPAELEAISFEQCRIYEAIERWMEAPEGSILGSHASLGLALIFLKKDERHINWARRKLANVERLGYIFPPAFREQMAERWGLTTELVGRENSVEEWWLPNGEGCLPMVSEIRKVVKERHENGDEKLLVNSTVGDVRDLKAIFKRLDLRTQASTHGQAGGGEGFSPQSDGTRSASSAGLGSPSSVASTGIHTALGEGGWSDGQKSSANVTMMGNGNGNGGGRASRTGSSYADRMSGVWS